MGNNWKTFYTVNAVGDANCIYIARIKCLNASCAFPFDEILPLSTNDTPYCKRKSFMIDFGYQNETFFTNRLKHQIFDTDEFLLSHYHLDHYKGLTKIADNSLSLERIYYPFIPQMQNRYTLLRAMYFINCLDGGELIGLVRQKNVTRNFVYEPVYIGKQIFDNKYEVVWPPRTIQKETKILSDLQKGIKKIEDKLNERPEIKDIWEKFNRFPIDAHSLLLKNDHNDSLGLIKGSKNDFQQYKETINSIRDEIRDVTNRFSVCLYKKNEFLFLGDLEKEEVAVCVRELFERNGNKPVYVKYLITPHHGTKNHYSPDVDIYLKADYIISSNGEARYNDYAKQYGSMNCNSQIHCTNINGNFIKSAIES